MATSRTGTARWKATVRAVRHRDRHITHCPRCATPLDWQHGRRPNSAEVDHITPHSAGGKDTPDNAQILCRRCNQQLGAKQTKTSSRNRPQPAIELTTTDDW